MFVLYIKPKNIENGSMMFLVLSYILYMILYLLNKPTV